MQLILAAMASQGTKDGLAGSVHDGFEELWEYELKEPGALAYYENWVCIHTYTQMHTETKNSSLFHLLHFFALININFHLLLLLFFVFFCSCTAVGSTTPTTIIASNTTYRAHVARTATAKSSITSTRRAVSRSLRSTCRARCSCSVWSVGFWLLARWVVAARIMSQFFFFLNIRVYLWYFADHWRRVGLDVVQ